MKAALQDLMHTSDAADQLFIAHYEKLRRMAQRELRYGVRATLGPTTLLHETFLDISRRASLRFADGGQFMAYATRAMRGLVICHLRNRHAQKRGSGLAVACLPAEPHAAQVPAQSIETEKLSQALECLAQIDPRLAECVDLKFFCGFSFKEIAQTRSVSERTVRREWDKAKLLLHRLISDCDPDEAAADDAGSWDGPANRRIGAYSLERLIDCGGTSEVWLATHREGRFGGRCAIKLAARSAGEPMFGDVLRREGQLLARLEHPNIPRLLDQGATGDGRQFLVLDYVEGEHIDQYCRSRQLPVAARLRLFLDVLAAVAHVHDRLIIHRDLKPANVLVSHDGAVKLLDFGIAQLLRDAQNGYAARSSEVNASELTPEYAAPEQLHGAVLSPATDVYQLGMLLYALLSDEDATRQPSGNPAKRIEAAAARHTSQLAQAPLRARLPDGVAAALAKALDANPSRRYPTAAVFRGEIARLVT
jgi:RNA polymerase sigma factor (TIGR02999 family)